MVTSTVGNDAGTSGMDFPSLVKLLPCRSWADSGRKNLLESLVCNLGKPVASSKEYGSVAQCLPGEYKVLSSINGTKKRKGEILTVKKIKYRKVQRVTSPGKK